MSGCLPDAVQETMPALRIVVSGRVQGVGFRYFVSSTARDLGIAGEVWNKVGGGVEIHAESDDIALLGDFARQMWDGPGRVEDVVVEPDIPHGEADFGIGYTR